MQLTQAVNYVDRVTKKMEVFRGCCHKHQIRPILRFFLRVFFTPLRYDYPFDATLVVWQYESRIKGTTVLQSPIVIDPVSETKQLNIRYKNQNILK